MLRAATLSPNHNSLRLTPLVWYPSGIWPRASETRISRFLGAWKESTPRCINCNSLGDTFFADTVVALPSQVMIAAMSARKHLWFDAHFSRSAVSLGYRSGNSRPSFRPYETVFLYSETASDSR